MAAIQDWTAGGFDKTSALLTRAVISGHKYAARQFRRQGSGGSIISTSSTAGLEAGLAGVSYTAAKHAVIGIVRQATAELAQFGIRSNAICPGFTMTERVAHAFGCPPGRAEEFMIYLGKKLAMTQPIGRVGAPRDIAEAALFLASDASSFVTGIALTVDGGATCLNQSGFAELVAQAAADFI